MFSHAIKQTTILKNNADYRYKIANTELVTIKLSTLDINSYHLHILLHSLKIVTRQYVPHLAGHLTLCKCWNSFNQPDSDFSPAASLSRDHAKLNALSKWKSVRKSVTEERGGGGSVIYTPLPEALASSFSNEMAVITSRGRHHQSAQIQLHWWGHEKTWYELVRDLIQSKCKDAIQQNLFLVESTHKSFSLCLSSSRTLLSSLFNSILLWIQSIPLQGYLEVWGRHLSWTAQLSVRESCSVSRHKHPLYLMQVWEPPSTGLQPPFV